MKTVGIVTMHCSTSPGASLQTHAIYKKVAELNYQPIIIDYRSRNSIDIAERVRLGTANGRERLKMLVLKNKLNARYRLFQQFESEYYPVKTDCYRSVEQINTNPPVLDAYLCGSDQIWNPAHVNYNKTYFLEFARDLPGIRISYAASVGQDEVDEQGRCFLKSGADILDHISVREDTAKQLLQSEVGIENKIEQHIDPTMLYPASYWRGLARAPKQKLPEKYIFYFPLQDNPIAEPLICEVKKQTGLPCVALSSALRKPRFSDYQVGVFGPREFLYLVDHAEYVLTNSFHGIVMSLLLESNLIPYRNLTRNSRIESLFRTLKLENMQVDSLESYQSRKWDALWREARGIDDVLSGERSRATEYLSEVLP